MNRDEKKSIRKEITSILDSECKRCQYSSSYKTKDSPCISVCPVSTQLQKLSSKLINDNEGIKKKKEFIEDNKNIKRGSWTLEEEMYLINHSKYFSVRHIAKKLNRSLNAVYVKLDSLKKLEAKVVS